MPTPRAIVFTHRVDMLPTYVTSIWARPSCTMSTHSGKFMVWLTVSLEMKIQRAIQRIPVITQRFLCFFHGLIASYHSLTLMFKLGFYIFTRGF
jgi:hypothetical protein